MSNEWYAIIAFAIFTILQLVAARIALDDRSTTTSYNVLRVILYILVFGGSFSTAFFIMLLIPYK